MLFRQKPGRYDIRVSCLSAYRSTCLTLISPGGGASNEAADRVSFKDWMKTAAAAAGDVYSASTSSQELIL